MADWRNLTEHLLNVSETYDVESLSFDEIEAIIHGGLPTSSSERWFWVNTPARWYSRYWRDAGWLIRDRGVNLASRRVDFVRTKGKTTLATSDANKVDGGNGPLMRAHTPTSVGNRATFREIQVPLTRDELQQFASLSTEKKAVAIVTKHLEEKYLGRNIEIRKDVKGADIRVVFKDSKEEDEIIEVEGTVKPSVAWGQLKVSLQSSYDRIIKGVPIYRVVDVNSEIPRIIVMSHGKDFTLEEELRWAAKPLSG